MKEVSGFLKFSIICAAIALVSACGQIADIKLATEDSGSQVDDDKDNADQTTGEPSIGEPSTGEPSTGEPSTGEPSTGEPSTGEPSTGEPSTGEPSTGEPSTGEPSTGTGGEEIKEGEEGEEVTNPDPSKPTDGDDTTTDPDPSTDPDIPVVAPEGYRFAAHQGAMVEVNGTVDIAYGSDVSNLHYLTGVTQNTLCTGSSFGLQIETMEVKYCFVKAAAPTETEDTPVDNSPDQSVDPEAEIDPETDTDKPTQPETDPDATPNFFEYELYNQTDRDPLWHEVLDSGDLNPLQTATSKGYMGSVIDVQNSLVETTPYAKNRAVNDSAKIHTLANPSLAQSSWQNWTRWYQIDGDTEVFRLFKDEENVSNDRALAARIEAFNPSDRWLPEGAGVWREFTARYTIVKAEGCGIAPAHTCSIFQAKGNNVDHWSVMIRLDENGDVWVYPREDMSAAFVVARNMEGKGFDLRVRDNGLDYQVYIDQVLRFSGQWQRTEEIGFRWGIYVGESEVVGDVMIFVSGAKAYTSLPPEGYVHAADVGETVNIIGRMDIAYGAAGQFTYLLNQRQSMVCNNANIGEDPAVGVKKQCFTRVSPDDSAPESFAFLANAQEYFDVIGTMDIAWGANGQFNYRRNLVCGESCSKLTFKCDRENFGDPAPGISKKCYYKSVPASDGPSGYEYVGEKDTLISVTSKTNLAWGSQGLYHYLYDQTADVTCNNESFGGDPNYGKKKSCYRQEVLEYGNNTPDPEPEPEPEPAPAPELTAPDCTSDPFDAKGDVAKLAITLQQATNTGKPVTLTGTYRISEDMRIYLKKDLTVDASEATFIGTSNLDGDLFSFDTHDTKSKECNSAEVKADVTWTGGSFNMSAAKVSTVVPYTPKTPAGREGTAATADALSFRGATKNNYSKLNHLIVEEITFTGTKNETDNFFLAGGDSGILMTGALKATIRNNKFYGVRDAAVYLSAGGENGIYGDNFTIINNYVERAYDGFTSKRGADNILMKDNVLDDVAVGLSIKRVYDGWTATNVRIVNNDVNNAARAISVERANNVTITGNNITNFGDVVATESTPINKYGQHYEGIALNGVQGDNLIENNSIQGMGNSRKAITTTYGIVTRFEDGRETTGEVIKNNTYQNLDNNIKRF